MSLKDPKITVVISCYNHQDYLKESIKSIQNQTWQNLDICVINDGSDSTEQINDIMATITTEDDRVRYISYATNIGKWHGLNLGIESSSTQVVTSHDADDVALADRIERQFLCMKNTDTIHNLCGFYHCYNEEDVDRYKLIRQDDDLKMMQPSEVSQLILKGYNTPGINHYYTGDFETAGVSAMFLSQVWRAGMRFNPPGMGLRTLLSEDSDFNFRLTVLLGRTSILAEQLYCYRRFTSTNKEEV